jgi:hypothetical protein
MRRLLVFIVALAGVIDGSFIVGGPLAAWLAPGPLIGYLPIALLFLGAAVGAAVAASITADVLFRTSRGRYLPVLALTAIAGAAVGVSEVWLEEHLIGQPYRAQLLLAAVVLVALIAAAAATIIRAQVPGHGRTWSVVMIGVIVILVLLALLLSWIVIAFSLSSSAFG